ncbi:MAG: hypothetical protein JWP08_1415 [Bryobacterales bacterium]|nr:hypothetical protein [Bryobacterales bacterium]
MQLIHWARAKRFEHIPSLSKFGHVLCNMIHYLELNADSLPKYGKSRPYDVLSCSQPLRCPLQLRFILPTSLCN